MERFVLDASFAVSWVVESERTTKLMECLSRLKSGHSHAVVPALWPDEIANVLLSMEKARKLNAAQIAAWVDVFCQLPITINPPVLEESLGDVRHLAQAHKLTAYDARYLHLAMRDELPLATLDKELLKAATKAGVEIIA